MFKQHIPFARDDFTPQRLTQAHVSEDKGDKTNVFANSLKQALLRLLSPGVAPSQKMDNDAALEGRGGSSSKGNAGEKWQLLVSDSRPYVVRDILPISCGQQVNDHTRIVDRDLSLSYDRILSNSPFRPPARTHARPPARPPARPRARVQMIRHKDLGLAVEIPLEGTSGLIFSTCAQRGSTSNDDVAGKEEESNGAERRIWRWQPDGSFYERFSFRTGNDLHKDLAVPLDWEEARYDLTSALDGFAWKWDFSDDRRVGLAHEQGFVQLYLTRDGFGVCGIDSQKGLIVAGTAGPELLDLVQWRARLHAPGSSPSHLVKEDLPALNKQRRRLGTVHTHKGKEDADRREGSKLPPELLCPLTG
jgi:hypothetical protein